MTTENVRDVLIEARRLLSEKGWVQGARARDKQGRSVLALSPEAEGFCAYGAIERAAVTLHPDGDPNSVWYFETTQAMNKAELPARGSVVGYNDSPSRHADEILYLFDLAIEQTGA